MNAPVIPRRPLLWLAAAFLFLVPTMFGQLAAWLPLFFLTTLVAKFWMETRDLRLRSTVSKLTLALLGFGAVVLTYGKPTGIEAGVSLLVVLAGLKLLESHTARDFHVLVMIGWVLCLCGFLMAQDFAVALCILAAFVLLTAALVQFHRRRAPGGPLWPPLRTAGKLLLQALPLVLLLFILFPRGTAGLRLRLPGSPADSVGFSGELAPGTVASVADSPEIAFRAEFPDRNPPPRERLYWRGAVLWQGDGLNWTAGAGLGEARPSERIGSEPVRQRITLEPHAGRWLFALDRPLFAPAGSTLAPGRYLRSFRPVTNIRRYDVTSAERAGEDLLLPRERSHALRPPSVISPEMQQLVQSWTAQSDDPRDIVRAALEFFRTGGFVYSISPGPYTGGDPVGDLLFRRKTGFCEHYAGSFVTLMRVAGVPARVVVGYLGGEWNAYGNYLLVRQSDAHAWCEVWLPERGWERVDPTSVIAPERLSLGSLRQLGTSVVQSRPGAQPMTIPQAGAAQEMLDHVRLAWDTVSFAWDSRVLSFDLEGQRELFSAMGWSELPGVQHLLWIAVVAAALLGFYAVWLSRRARAPADAVKELYDRFCRQAARLGAARAPTEGPADFAQRAAQLLPAQAERIDRISRSYVALRYSPAPGFAALQTFHAEVRAFTRQTSPVAPAGKMPCAVPPLPIT